MNYSTLNFPLLFKYRFLNNGNTPYVVLGPIYSRMIKNDAILYHYQITGNDISIETNNTPVIQNNMGGFTIGSGLIFDLKGKYKWFGGFQYNYLFNLDAGDNNFNLGEFSITGGILF